MDFGGLVVNVLNHGLDAAIRLELYDHSLSFVMVK